MLVCMFIVTNLVTMLRMYIYICSGEGGPINNTLCLYKIYCHNNLTGQWPHYCPTRDLFPDALIPNHICTRYQITHSISNHLCIIYQITRFIFNHSSIVVFPKITIRLESGLVKIPERTAPRTCSAPCARHNKNHPHRYHRRALGPV